MKKNTLYLLIITIACSCSVKAPESKQSGNILDITAYPEIKAKTKGLFSDQGAWFGFCLLPENDNNTGFGGPWVISEKRWVSLSLAQFEAKIENENSSVKFTKQNQIYHPGKLETNYSADSFNLNQILVFGDQGVAYIVATLTNTSSSSLKVNTCWYGSSWEKIRIKGNNQVCINFRDERYLSIFSSKGEKSFTVDTVNNSYRLESPEFVSLKKGEQITTWIAISLSFTEKELQQNEKIFPVDFEGVTTQLVASKNRWDGYLKSVLLNQNSEYDRIAIKSVMTLISNWRKAGLDLHHDGIIPSHAVTYFDGFWAWDSWKHSVAVSLFDPNLAKNQILAMFDYQDSVGMIPDCIFLDKAENNLRDTKPPLAAWAVYETFKNCNDTAFVKDILPKLVAYHEWWYKFRDVNKNGWCEFGSIDGTLEAAAWESGMDNAVRFDSVKMLHTSGNAWSMDQESVDLNAFLVAEKHYLSELFKIAGNVDESAKYSNEFKNLKTRFDDYFFDISKGYYYDVSLNNGKKIEIDGTEAFIPLWAGITSKEHSIGLKKIIMNPNKFNTYMPFPTLSADNPKFDPNGYWRGPVWLDQAWFGVAGLDSYHYTSEAKELILKLFNNAEGLMSDKPIHENYSPLTGERIKAPHFSWSAAHYLLLYRMGYHLGSLIP